MSVVNQMLRDLNNNSMPHAALDYQAVKQSTPLRYLFIGGICFLLLGLSYWLLNKTHSTSEDLLRTSIAKHSSQPSTNISTNPLILEPIIEESATPVINTPITRLVNQEPTSPQPETNEKLTPTVPQIVDTESPIVIEKPETKIATNVGQLPAAIVQPEIDATIKIQSSKSQLDQQLAQIKKNYTPNDVAASISALDKLLAENSEHHGARLYLLSLCLQAIDCPIENRLRNAVTQYPEQSNYRLIAARHFFEKNQFNIALEVLSNLLPSQDQFLALMQMRALVYQSSQQYQSAIRDYYAILNFSPNRGDIYLAMGIAYESLGDREQARLSFQNATHDASLSDRQQQFLSAKINRYQD